MTKRSTEARFPIDATATRVPTIEGHLLSVKKSNLNKNRHHADEKSKRYCATGNMTFPGLDLPIFAGRTALERCAPTFSTKMTALRSHARTPIMKMGCRSGLVGSGGSNWIFDAGLVGTGVKQYLHRRQPRVAILNAELLVKQGFIQ